MPPITEIEPEDMTLAVLEENSAVAEDHQTIMLGLKLDMPPSAFLLMVLAAPRYPGFYKSWQAASRRFKGFVARLPPELAETARLAAEAHRLLWKRARRMRRLCRRLTRGWA